MFCVADRVRPEARIAVVTTLISDDEFNVMMRTGDGDGAANAIAKKVGLPAKSVRSQFLPQKTSCIRERLSKNINIRSEKCFEEEYSDDSSDEKSD